MLSSTTWKPGSGRSSLAEGPAMHETTLAAQLLRRIERAARAEGAARVTAVRLRVGEFAGVEPELLRIGFLRLAAGTMAEGARLEVEPVPLEAECAECGLRFRV